MMLSILASQGMRKLSFHFRKLLVPMQRLLYEFARVNPKETLGNFPSTQITGILPVLGYGLLLVSFGDFINTIFPLQQGNPIWELEVIDSIANQTWAFLIGIGFISTRYFKENQVDIRFFELFLLRAIRWLLFTMGIIYLLLMPLVWIDSNRVSTIFSQQIVEQQETKNAQIAQLEVQKSRISNPQQIRQIGQALGINPDILKGASDSEVSKRIDEKIATIKTQLKTEAEEMVKAKKTKIRQSMVKTFYSQFLQIVIFFFVWFKIGLATKKL